MPFFFHPLLLLLLPSLVFSQCPDVLPSITDKIINGNPTVPSYHISLSSPPTPAIRRCTGTLISPSWAVTAAHCQVNQSWVAQIAGNNITNGIPLTILQVFSHPAYIRPTDRRYDIAAIQLQPVSGIRPIRLNTKPNLPTPGAFVRVAGYGANTTDTPTTFGQLTHVDIPTVPFEQCTQYYAGTPNLGRLDSSKQLCAGYTTGGCDACSGDSGGPIVQFDSRGRAVQVGLISASRGCALPKFPGIAVRLNAYVDWLSGLGIEFETGEGLQVFRGPESIPESPVVSPSPSPLVVKTPRPVLDPVGSPEPSPLPTQRLRPGRRPGQRPGKERPDGQNQGIGEAAGPRLPPPVMATPPSDEVFDGEELSKNPISEEEEVKTSEEVDQQASEALANDVAVAGEIEGGGVSAGAVVGGVLGGLVLVAVLGGVVFLVIKNR